MVRLGNARPLGLLSIIPKVGLRRFRSCDLALEEVAQADGVVSVTSSSLAGSRKLVDLDVLISKFADCNADFSTSFNSEIPKTNIWIRIRPFRIQLPCV